MEADIPMPSPEGAQPTCPQLAIGGASISPSDPASLSEGEQVLADLRAQFRRYVVLPSEDALTAVTLWVAATHLQMAWQHAPRLAIVGPAKRCGKSRLLDVITQTVHDPLITVNASAAAVFRSITDNPPTLLVDEADTLFGSVKVAEKNEEMRGLLNAGHQRNRPTLRVSGPSHEVSKFHALAPLLQRTGLRAQYLGWLRRPQLWKTFTEHDVLAIPSTTLEAMGLVALEAQACGLPVLYQPVPGLNEVLAASGAATDFTHSATLARDLGRLRTAPSLLSALRQAGYANAARYPLSATAQALVDLGHQLT